MTLDDNDSKSTYEPIHCLSGKAPKQGSELPGPNPLLTKNLEAKEGYRDITTNN